MAQNASERMRPGGLSTTFTMPARLSGTGPPADRLHQHGVHRHYCWAFTPLSSRYRRGLL